MKDLKSYLIVFFISMVPLVELRGAIPVAVGFGCDASTGDFILAFLVCVLGNMLPVPVIYLFARKFLEWGKDKKMIGKICFFFLEKGHKGGQKLMKKSDKGLFIALLLFVGIPLPGTGAWTGTLAASILDMGFKKSTLAVTLGVLLAGIIMAVASLVFKVALF